MIHRVVLHPQRRNVVVVESDNATDELAKEINDWVFENDLGVRIAFLMWKLKSEESVTLFLMRWAQ